jgi:transposase
VAKEAPRDGLDNAEGEARIGAAPRCHGQRTPRLWRHLEAHPEATLEEHCELGERGGARVSVTTIRRAIHRLRWTYKKVNGSAEISLVSPIFSSLISPVSRVRSVSTWSMSS